MQEPTLDDLWLDAVVSPVWLVAEPVAASATLAAVPVAVGNAAVEAAGGAQLRLAQPFALLHDSPRPQLALFWPAPLPFGGLVLAYSIPGSGEFSLGV